MREIIVREYDNGYTIEYHANDKEGNDKLHHEVLANKAELKAKLLEIFK